MWLPDGGLTASLKRCHGNSLEEDVMAATQRNNANRWQDWTNLVLAVWLVISPWLLQFAAGFGVAAWNAWISGVIVAVIAGAALMRAQPWEEWTNLVIGAWLVISPWVLAFSGNAAATWNTVAVGLLVLALAGWELKDIRQATVSGTSS